MKAATEQAVIIRKAGLNDVEALMAIEMASFPSDQLSVRQMRYLICKAKAKTFVVQSDNTIAGYATVLLPVRPRCARLYSIAVVEVWRHKKIGACLLQAVVHCAEEAGYSVLRLEVRVSAESVQAFYRRMGFVAINRLPNYYADGEDGVKMQKLLATTK